LNFLSPKEFPDKLAVYQEINNLLNKADMLIEPEIQADDSYKVCKAKIAMWHCKAILVYNRKGVEKKYVDDLKEGLISLESYGAQRLLMKAHFLYSEIILELEKKRIGTPGTAKSVENSVEEIRQVVRRLVEVKNLHLTKYALHIAHKIKDK